MKIDLTIEICTPWHIGTGLGETGVTDAATRRSNGHGVLGGTYLKGLLRDRARSVVAVNGQLQKAVRC